MEKKKEMARPVVFVHQGNSFYLRDTVCHAEKTCSQVVLIGDNTNLKVAKVHYLIDDYVPNEYEQFIRNYKHMSTNPYEFELICFKRYFVLYEWMKSHDIHEAVMVDSDVIIFENLSVFDFKDYEVTVAIEEYSGYRWAASPGCFFVTIEALKDFLHYILDVYENQLDLLEQKMRWNAENKVPGGICDMTLLFLWITHTSRNVYNIYDDKYEGWFDNTYSNPENRIGFQMIKLTFDPVKKIIRKDKKIFFITNQGKLKPVYTIHAAGKGKLYIPYLVRGTFKEPYLTMAMRIIALGIEILKVLGK